MTVVKLDPQAVRAIADRLEDVADRLAVRRRRIERLLEEAGASSTASARIREFEELVEELCPQMRLRADMAAAADQLLTAGVDPGFVAEAPLAPGSPEGVWVVRALLNLLKRPGSTRVLAVRGWAQGLDPADWEALLRTAPELVGPVGGMPLERRYQANRLLIQRALAATSAEVARLSGTDGDRATALRQREQTLRGLLADPTRQFLLFDNTGDGRVAEVLGDLPNADHVAFVIPGITNTLDNFDANVGTNGRRLHDEAFLRAPHSPTAVVAWLGYDTPGIPDAILRVKAEIGGKALHDFVDGLLLEEPVVTTVVGHSYGSLVAGKALQGAGLEVDNVAVIGSPGMGVDAVEELGLDESTGFFAAGAPMDGIAWSHWHGADPSDPRFGGIPFETGNAGSGAYPLGHSRYYEQGSESLRNLALIVTDQGHIVTVEPPTVLDRALIGVDRLQAAAGQLGWAVQSPIDKAQSRIDTVGDIVGDVAELGGRIVRRQQ